MKIYYIYFGSHIPKPLADPRFPTAHTLISGVTMWYKAGTTGGVDRLRCPSSSVKTSFWVAVSLLTS